MHFGIHLCVIVSLFLYSGQYSAVGVLWFTYSSVEGHLFPVFSEYELSSCKHLYIGFFIFLGKYIGRILLGLHGVCITS